jgi:drug/metabolite transporter (DMT)-like permease
MTNSNLRGIIAMVAAMGVFTAAESSSKLVFANVPMFEVLFLRGVVGTLLCFAAAVAMGYGRDLLQAFNPFVLARGGLEVAANTSFVWAIFYMPIADVTALIQTAPLIVLIGAAYIYGEPLGSLRIGIIFLGFLGALLVAQPGGGAASPYAMLGFLAAALVAARDLLIRLVPQFIAAPVATCAVMACLTLAAAIGMFFSNQPPVVPGATEAAIIFLAGALIAVGHLSIFLAYRKGEVRAIAPFIYSLTIWAVGFGYAFFGDVPNRLAMAGMALILVAGLLVIYTDRRKAAAANNVAEAAE